MNEQLSSELAEIQSDAIEKVIRLADKHGIDRDKLIMRFVTVGFVMAQVGSFKDYKFGGNEN